MTDKVNWRGIFKVIEECGELIQVLGKLGLKPSGKHWSGDLHVMLVEEVSDLYAALDYFCEKNQLSTSGISLRRKQKLDLFHEWNLTGLADEEGTG